MIDLDSEAIYVYLVNRIMLIDCLYSVDLNIAN